jgi:hypothetical protein
MPRPKRRLTQSRPKGNCDDAYLKTCGYVYVPNRTAISLEKRLAEQLSTMQKNRGIINTLKKDQVSKAQEANTLISSAIVKTAKEVKRAVTTSTPAKKLNKVVQGIKETTKKKATTAKKKKIVQAAPPAKKTKIPDAVMKWLFNKMIVKLPSLPLIQTRLGNPVVNEYGKNLRKILQSPFVEFQDYDPIFIHAPFEKLSNEELNRFLKTIAIVATSDPLKIIKMVKLDKKKGRDKQL